MNCVVSPSHHCELLKCRMDYPRPFAMLPDWVGGVCLLRYCSGSPGWQLWLSRWGGKDCRGFENCLLLVLRVRQLHAVSSLLVFEMVVGSRIGGGQLLWLSLVAAAKESRNPICFVRD